MIIGKVLGIGGVCGVAAATLIVSCLYSNTESELNNYQRDATNVATRMEVVILRVMSLIQGSATFAHLRVTAEQQRDLQSQQHEIQYLLRENANQRQTNNQLQTQIAQIMNRLDQP